jgi:hypothetical protein
MIEDVKPPEVKAQEPKPKKRLLAELPEPKKLMSGLIILVVLALVIKFWPSIVVGIFGDYSQKNPSDMGPIIFGLFGVIAVLVLVIAGVWSCRGIWWPFMRASWTGNSVLGGFSKNKRLTFLTPKEINWNHIRIDGESTIDVDPDSVYISPNKVPFMAFIPDHARTLDPRGLVLNSKKDLSLDINTLDNIGTLNLIKGMKKMTNPLGSLLNSGVLWIMMAGGILFLVMWPYFSAQMDASAKVGMAQTAVLQCNQELVAHGLPPVGVALAEPTTSTTLPSNAARPNAGITTNPNDIGK